MMKFTKLLSVIFVPACLNLLPAAAQSRPRLYELVYGGLTQNVEGKMEYNDADNTKSMNYYNSDYCPYVLSRENDGSYLIHPGKNTLFTVKTGQENPWKTTSSYRYWRGQFIKDFDIMTPYALPVKPGAKVKWEQDRRHRQKTMNFDMEAYDTVYAVRGGTACVCSDDNALLIVHKDNTMSLYITLSDVFISPGEKIEVGQAVGLADYGGVDICWFFLDKNRFEGDVARDYPYAHFIPYFSTSEGLVQPEESKEYEAVMSDEVATLDMSKSAKKKYLKKKGK